MATQISLFFVSTATPTGKGYYLIGYQPEAGTLAPDATGKFRHVKIKLTRKGLNVRTRSGFYAVASE